MTTDTKAAPGPSFAQTLNPAAENVVDFPAKEGPPVHRYTTADVNYIVNGGVKRLNGSDVLRPAMNTQAARNWLTGAHARGEIDDAQLELFWPGGGK